MVCYPQGINLSKVKSQVFQKAGAFLSQDAVESAFRGFSIRHNIYHTYPLFNLFLHQIGRGESCSETVSYGQSVGLIPLDASPGTQAYCNARNRLPEAPARNLAFTLGLEIESKARRGDLFRGRRVKVVDGSSLKLPDTSKNQMEYPQPAGQKEGCGQPVIYLCALMGLATGAILDVALGGRAGHERSLFRKLWPSLKPKDILLGDAGFASFADIALLNRKLEVDVVFRERKDFLKNKKKHEIGKNEWLVEMPCPKTLGDWVLEEDLPFLETIVVRAVLVKVPKEEHSRAKEMIIVTTLLNVRQFSAKKIAGLYRRRWEMELSFRNIKTTMGLKVLRCKTPKRCRMELWMGLIAYNIVRGVMLDAGRKAGVEISRLSFKKTLRKLEALSFCPLRPDDPDRLYAILLRLIRDDKVPHRPDRSEPREVKLRSIEYSLMTKPRHDPSRLPCSA